MAWRSSEEVRPISSSRKALESEARSSTSGRSCSLDSPRPFAIRELVKLAVAGVDRRILFGGARLEDGSLAITGCAREGLNADSDAFVKIIASNPGCSLDPSRPRSAARLRARHRSSRAERNWCSAAGPIRRALETTAVAAGLDGDAVSDYLDAVRSIVREMAAHGRGGIVIISHEEQPPSRGVCDTQDGARLVVGGAPPAGPAHQTEIRRDPP